MGSKPSIVIVGGGAAGFFAAVQAAEAAPQAEVVILEQSRQFLAKVRISGGGRCNLTHACFEPRRLIEAYPRGRRELRGPFHQWQPRDTIRWFEERGVATKTEADGRMFPVSDDSRSVIEALTVAAHEAGVRLRPQCAVNDFQATPDGAWELSLSTGDTLRADRLLLAAGGLKPGKLMTTLTRLGHTIAPLAPSLFTFHLEDPRLADLAGLACPSAQLTLPAQRLTQTGPVLITHWGLSGPATLKLSAFAARELFAAHYEAPLQVNWTGQPSEAIRTLFGEERHQHGKRQVQTHPLGGVPKRLWQRLATTAGIGPDVLWGQLPKAAEQRFLTELTAGAFLIRGKSVNKEEFVTCGGVALAEVDFRTMESRRAPGLHFAGEVLDIDAVTGGYNFQAAWTTGYLAGRAMAAAVTP